MSVLLTEDEENVHKDIIPRDGREIYHDFVSTDFSSLLFAFNAQERPQREAGAKVGIVTMSGPYWATREFRPFGSVTQLVMVRMLWQATSQPWIGGRN